MKNANRLQKDYFFFQNSAKDRMTHFNKTAVQSLEARNFIKTRLWHRPFLVNLHIFQEHLYCKTSANGCFSMTK